MNFRLFLFAFIFIIAQLFESNVVLSQSIERQVISGSGDYYSTSVGQLEWTLGEVSTEYLTNSGAGLSQGFHQNYIDVIGIDNPQNVSDFKVYPNPMNEGVFIEHENIFSKLTTTIFDLNGKLVHREELEASSSKIYLSLSNLSSGIYLLVLESNDVAVQNFKLIKN